MEDEKPKISWEEAKKMLEAEYPHGVDLVYVSYDDKLNEEQLQEVLEKGFIEDWQWTDDCSYEAIDQMEKELFKDYDISVIQNSISDWCYEHDTSNPLKDLLNHNNDIVFYYRLGHEVSGYDGNDFKGDMKLMKSLFKPKDAEAVKTLEKMVKEAGYGGEVVIMFKMDGSDLLLMHNSSFKYLTFTDPTVAIMDRMNGSGSFEQVMGTFQLPGIASRLRMDETAPGYALISDVYDCNSSAVEGSMNWSNKRKGHLLKVDGEDGISDFERKEAEYDKVFKEGKCSHGDINMKRHRDVQYINQYPCGSHCMDCKMFWID